MEIYDGYSRHGKKNHPEDVALILNREFKMHDDFLGRMLASRSGEFASKAAVLEFEETLRHLVIKWIQSGKNKDGVDSPSERVAPDSVLSKFNELMRRYPPLLETASSGLGLFITPLFFKQRDELARARDHARFWFMRLLDSPLRERLSCCDVCKTYFVRARKPWKPIKHGTFCGKHKGKGGAKRTLSSRQARKKQLLELVADSWPKWNPRRHEDRSQWVAEIVNKRLRRREITGKWVTQNRQAIEAELPGRSNAKKFG